MIGVDVLETHSLIYLWLQLCTWPIIIRSAYRTYHPSSWVRDQQLPLMFLQPISELYGRKMSIITPMFIFICLSAATATAKDTQTVFITRFFAGVMASAPVTNVGGVLADLYEQRERGTAVVFYSLAVVTGPTLG